jgi:hypothetical protein
MKRRNWLALSCGTLAVALACGGASVASAGNDKVKKTGNHDISAIHSIGSVSAAMQQIGHGRGIQGPTVNPAAVAIAVPAIAGPAASIGTGHFNSVMRSIPGTAPSALSAVNPRSPGNSGNSHGHGNAYGHGNGNGHGNAYGHGNGNGHGNAFGHDNGRGDLSNSGRSNSTSGNGSEASVSSSTAAVFNESGKSSGDQAGVVAATQPSAPSAARLITMPSCI